MTSQPAPKSAKPVPDLDDEPVESNDVGDPKKIGKYEIVRKLGQGGMGAVFLARDAALRRDVALKVLPKEKAENPTLVRRFQAEAQAAAKLRHDNIVAVYDSDAADGMCYIAMEFVDGKDLHEMVSRRGPVPVKRSIEIVKQVAQALQHAYEHNIVHRDIKPSNLLIRRDGVVKLTDLGLARSVDDSIETGITRAGTTVGTVDYMAPEQGRSSKAADIRSDLYSLGCTWYFMLTGQPPFPDGSLTNKLQAHAIKAPPDPRALNENVTDGLVAVIHRLLEKKPDARYQTPKELIEDLNTSALTRNAIAREIFDEPEEVYEPPTRGRSSKKSVLPDDSPIYDGPTRSRGVSKKPPTEIDEVAHAEVTSARKRAAEGPGPDVDIYADEPEEAPVVRRTRSASPVNSLDDESAVITSSTSTGHSSPAKSSRREPGVLPPPSRKSPEDIKEESPGINLEWLKIVGAAVGVVIVVGGLGWLVSGYASQLFFGSNPAGPVPAAVGSGKAGGPREVEVATVTGGGTSDKPILDSGTQVAQVIPTTKLGPDGKPLPPGQINSTGVDAEGGSLTTPNAVPTQGADAASTGTTTPFDPEKIPEWANAPASKHNTVMTVGPGANTGTHFGALSEALSRVGPDGALIQLIGGGPFILSTPSTITTKRLILSAESKSKPVIVLGSAGEGLIGSLKITGHLELNGIHISLDRQSWKGADPVKAFNVVEGTLTLRDCSATIAGTSSTPLLLFNLEASTPGGSRLLIDRCYVRGEPNVAVNLRCNMLDAVVRDSVIACGNGTALQLASASDSSEKANPARVLRSVNSTWCSQSRIFDLSGDKDRETPPSTHLMLDDSVFTTGSDQGERVLLTAADWVQDTLRQTLTWTSKSSAYVGFDTLLDLGSKSTFKVRSADNWRVFWQQKVEDEQFIAEPWPTGLGTLVTVAAIEFDRNQLPSAVQRLARKGEPIGTETAKLIVPESTHPARLAALSQRRPLPNEAVQAQPLGKTRKVDLKKEDLGVILSRADWTNGTVFEAVGFGNCLMTPVQLTNRQLRIVFRQAEGAPLKIVPKDGGKGVDALIRIERGSLEIEDLRYQPPEPRSTQPAWFLSAMDAQVILRRTELIGPEKISAPYLGGVKFVTSVNAPVSPPPTLSIVQCLMQLPGATVRVEGGAAAVFVRNSVLASRGTMLDLRPTAVQNGLPVSIDIVQSTLSATETILHMTAATLTQTSAARSVQCFVESCVFGPPFSLRTGDAEAPSLVTLTGPVRDQQQLVWWGQSNGVSRDIKTFVKFVGPAAPSITDAKAWSEWCGDGHDVHFLTLADGVMPHEPLPTRRDALKASSYTLHPSSKGIAWAEGRPIGADTKLLDGIGPVKAAPDPATNANSKKAAPNTKAVGTPKGGGF